MRKLSLAVLGLATVLSACSGLRVVDSEVSAYSQWPAERKPASYVFERLPSQQARPQEQAQLEEAARPALEAAGFKQAADAKAADVTVQVGLRVSRSDRGAHDDPFWWGAGLYRAPWGRPYWGPSFGLTYSSPHFEREVAVLMRDRQNNQPLYEAHARNDGTGAPSGALLGAMFQAALKDFPHTGINPRQVRIQLP